MLAVVHVLGQLLSIFGVTFLLPTAASLIYRDGTWWEFVLGGAHQQSGTGLLPSGPARAAIKRELKSRDGFLLVTLAWVLVAAAATIPLLLAIPGPELHRRVLRDDFGADHQRRHSPDGPRCVAAGDQPVALRAALVRRHGHHRAGARDPAAARRGWHADLQGRIAGAREGHEAHAAHYRNRQGAVVHVRRHHRRLHRLAQAMRHQLARCDLPCVFGDGTRWVFDLRHVDRALQLAAGGGRSHGLHADRRDEFRVVTSSRCAACHSRPIATDPGSRADCCA